MIKPLKIIHGKYNFQKNLQNLNNISAINIFNDNKKTIGTFTYKDDKLILILKDKMIIGYEEICNYNQYLLVQEKKLSLDIKDITNIDIKSDSGQWLLIRFEAYVFKEKYKIL